MAEPSRTAGPAVLGVDSGGSGLRLAVAPVAAPHVRPESLYASDTPVRTGERGIDAHHLLSQLLPAAEKLRQEAGASGFAAVCVGAAGMATLGQELRAVLPQALADAFGVRDLALATDAVTGYVCALGQRPGAVVAAGTGLIALGADPASGDGWRRTDGWGHLLGDCGSGAWIGRAGLEAALRAHDGRPGGSEALLRAAEERFGPIGGLPGQLYPRTDRPAVLASFAPCVAREAAGDPVAAGIVHRAAEHIADTAAAACPPGPDRTVALTGGLFRLGEVLRAPVRAGLAARLPDAVCAEPEGGPLDGALRLAAALATDAVRLPVDGALLQLVRRGR
ncbi:N-acetylglucosamine kinase [Streptomyces sp. NPDC014733]|uniref:N-acetylglucosamine kinase n=1 Tax=Streptomyces sp. NPDC014733 TaxID=3364885 RepID=UPI0036F90004